ncbi:MAG: SDR family oxidoreductase [Pseudomonadota bacterium]|nr:SDR family oxidoreductase [Pseudomonadota bacterium]
MSIPFNYAHYPSLAGKRVLVTGGGSGIGAGIVAAFQQQGADVFFIDLPASAPAPGFIPCDLTDLDALAGALATLLEGGAIDVLVNNAANDDRHTVQQVTPQYWDERMAVNLRHLFFCAQAVAPGMAANGGGAILNLGSISWHLAQANLSLYMTAKAAIEGLTRGLARDLGGDRIRVNCIIPGSVITPRQARWHSPEGEAHILGAQCLHERVLIEDIAAMALFLGSDNAARCTGRDYYVDAGWYGA